jgi:hypothetical protein
MLEAIVRVLRRVASGVTLDAALAVEALSPAEAARARRVAKRVLADVGCRECGGEGVCEPAGWGHDPAWPREVPCPGCRPREHAAAEMAADRELNERGAL